MIYDSFIGNLLLQLCYFSKICKSFPLSYIYEAPIPLPHISTFVTWRVNKGVKLGWFYKKILLTLFQGVGGKAFKLFFCEGASLSTGRVFCPRDTLTAELKVKARFNTVIRLDKLGLWGSQEPCCMYFPSVTALQYIGLQVTAIIQT